MIAAGNVFSNISPQGTHEQLTELLRAPALRVERIVSHGHASPPDFWYDQDVGEWVLLLEGAAVLRFENEPEPLRLGAAISSASPPVSAIGSNGPIRTGRRSGSPCITVELPTHAMRCETMSCAGSAAYASLPRAPGR